MEREKEKEIPARVLIVDDAPGISDVLGMKLEREGYVAVVAQSADRASKLLDADEFDIILLDVRLPDGSGFELLTRLRQRRSLLDTPIIMISGLGETSDVVAALQDGANDYITKPFDLAVVFARIRTQLSLKRLKEANDRFLHVAGNDLNKPLMAMLDVVRQLRTDFPPGTALTEDAHRSLGGILESVDYMRHVITDLLELRALRDRRMRVERLETDLGAIVRQAVARSTPYAKSKDSELRMEFERDLPNLRADDMRIMQVLENLIGNAIKFSPPGGVTTVRTSRDADWILCEVSDTGPGIPKKEMGSLFKEYVRLSTEPTGGEKSAGLGLAISFEIVLLHDGEIGVRNNPERGATFWFKLPID